MYKLLNLPDRIYRQFLSIDLMDLLEDIVDVPDLHCPVDRGGDDVVPGPDSQGFQLDDPPEVGV